ncbi:MAG: TIGR03862 family flavoprotein [Hyphomicrobiales bacterium]|nr:TIGR03862 family flavoprotein [Hyphomicrobiales bacterium]
MVTRRHGVVVGGGPAGLMAAEVMARAGHRVTLLERMPQVGRKLLMAGRGGLNLTHGEALDQFLGRYQGDAWLAAAIRAFPPDALRAFAADLGQPTFVGSSGRIFPEAMKSSPLLRLWLARLGNLGVTVQTRHHVTGLDAGLVLHGRRADGTPGDIAADAIVLAMGGASWPRLGADGNFVELLKTHAIDIATLEPANCGLVIAWSAYFQARFAGSLLKNITVQAGGKSLRGELVVTASGLEGGPVYALGPILRAALRQGHPAPLWLDLRPDQSAAELTRRLARSGAGASLATKLRKAGFTSAAQALMREAAPSLGSLSPAALVTLAKHLPLTAHATTGLDRAISTAGGVKTSAINDELMLKALPGVFVAGEMLDWDAPTGGYLLQACFATGARAGHAAARWLDAGPQP